MDDSLRIICNQSYSGNCDVRQPFFYGSRLYDGHWHDVDLQRHCDYMDYDKEMSDGRACFA